MCIRDSNTALSGQLEVTGVTTFTGAVENVVSTGIVTALQFSGNITGVAATFTGDVSIGGTLTYEDVTNIDSVGIVTARAGVNVSGGQFLVGTGVTIGVAGIATFRKGRIDVGDALSNTSIGEGAGDAHTTGSQNIAVGPSALTENTTGSANVAVGSAALDVNTTGTDNTAVGNHALGANVSGTYNVAVGAEALEANTGGNNTGVGHRALEANTTGGNNSALGVSALKVNTTGQYNVAVGGYALDANTTADSNVAVGYNALTENLSHIHISEPTRPY